MSEFSLELDITKNQIVTHRNPNLSQNGIRTSTEKGLYFQILFDLFKEEFNLPASFVYIGDCFCR